MGPWRGLPEHCSAGTAWVMLPGRRYGSGGVAGMGHGAGGVLAGWGKWGAM